MSYKSSERIAWEQSPHYAVIKFRDPETIRREELLEEFTDWLEDECDSEYAEVTAREIKALAADFLQYSQEKVKAGEQELLEQWIKACSK
jgi:hypothetical protein